MMKAARSRQITLILTLVATLVLLTVPAWAQGWGRRASSSAFGISFAYGGGDKGGRLELLSGQTVFDAGYFQDNDTDIYALELGWRGGEDGEALPFVVGTGYYYSRPEGGDSELPRLAQGDDFAAIGSGSPTTDHGPEESPIPHDNRLRLTASDAALSGPRDQAVGRLFFDEGRRRTVRRRE